MENKGLSQHVSVYCHHQCTTIAVSTAEYAMMGFVYNEGSDVNSAKYSSMLLEGQAKGRLTLGAKFETL